LKISFLVNEIAGGWKPTDTRLGGTEESVVEWSKELTKRGHQVDIYDNDNRDSYPSGYDVCINVKSPDKPPLEPTLYLTNEVDATRHDLSMYDGVIWPSQWAVDNIPVNNKTFILPHGYDPEKIYPGKKIRYQCFYASSPDRGLETLLKVWPEVYEKYPQATLLLTYGANVGYIPGVINLGEVDEETMNEIYRTSEIWCHPCNGGELYGISGIKAQVAGCWPVIIPTMALAETVKYGTFSNPEDYGEDLIKALGFQKSIPVIKYPTLQDSTTKLLEIIDSIISP
jgi:glycosyltransferase involved in cell wall biosynthesis